MKKTSRLAAALCLALGFAMPLFAQQLPAPPAQPSVVPVTPAPQPVAPLPPEQQPPTLLTPVQQVMGQAPPIYLSLNDAITLAFQRNLDLKVELFNPAIGEAVIRQNLGIYDPVLSASANYQRNVSPNNLTFVPFSLDDFLAQVGVSQLLPYGGTVGANWASEWVSNSSSYWSNGGTLTGTQPLLRNFGRETTELNISVARFSKEESLERFRARLNDTVAQVRNDYFKLYNLQENLTVQRTALALANRILEETRGRVRAGVLPAMEILSAEFASATREKSVIDAERAVRDQMDVLRQSLQIDPTRDIVITSQPTRESYPVFEDEALATALKNRPELAEQRVAIKINDLQRRVARNRTLPELNVNASVGTSGFGRGYWHSFDKAVTLDEPVWGIGLQFNYPIGNRAAENDYIRSKLTVEQSKTQLQSLESGVVTDVKTAVRLLASSYKQLDVTARGTAYAEERLRAFRKRNAVGLATTKDVFDVENDLVTAQGNQIQAVVDYNNAITQLWRVTGTILDRQGITINDRIADPLYQSAK